jgi:hypothetical protein
MSSSVPTTEEIWPPRGNFATPEKVRLQPLNFMGRAANRLVTLHGNVPTIQKQLEMTLDLMLAELRAMPRAVNEIAVEQDTANFTGSTAGLSGGDR